MNNIFQKNVILLKYLYNFADRKKQEKLCFSQVKSGY